MVTAKVFTTGRSQAVRLPKKFRFSTSEVNVQATPDGLLLTEKGPWELFNEGIEELSDDFMSTRIQPPLETRTF
ncbi:MAG: AbrB/MazE/SpoVT family DNA-binding domain-containing protein [Lentisphaerae bacterium]|mgnify:FL=1|nr:AbrB/MazE/SpoVT family DNA-binding domain-containing protein [Lentisphaerota bacterium]MBT4822646.1 AbrB/MazE/SpoVT family DNA-binding domain-containing protein [Lentisphaerota bacterium]MBT5608738.1 AbrB/MazE/SpoVT family DNA-binding domain-containing protein [Lentisphaerota bacterium]MBT7054101.1 AbrB/MazE/SpoVT family DNA-binding domain-containing protein [Lentisphaerota bacterium]MBT7845140.1 AbrB/MazE/SpoVT family DNA-binding domain-containing protein [Lentisphaerota bacterium]